VRYAKMRKKGSSFPNTRYHGIADATTLVLVIVVPRGLQSPLRLRRVRENEPIPGDIDLIRTSCLKLHCDLLIDSLNLRPH
jgi:hypothetical protein